MTRPFPHPVAPTSSSHGGSSSEAESASTNAYSDADGDSDHRGSPCWDPDLIHFAGLWSGQETERVGRAICRIENRHPVGNATRALGEPWVCTSQIVAAGQRYTVHRAGHPTIITARSIRGLVLRLYTWAMSLDDA